MAPRLDLHALLKTFVDNVYFQPPESLQMVYPCIVYRRDRMDIHHADNRPFKHLTRYQVTVIDRDPDSVIPDKVADISTCSYDRSFVSDNLNHDVYNLFF